MPEIVVIQCTFLLHVLWMFSASHMDKVLLQHKRSSLAARCWDLTCPLQRQGTANIDDEGAWQAWLAEEERLRAEECILGRQLPRSRLTIPKRLIATQPWRALDVSSLTTRQSFTFVVLHGRLHHQAQTDCGNAGRHQPGSKRKGTQVVSLKSQPLDYRHKLTTHTLLQLVTATNSHSKLLTWSFLFKKKN